MSSGSSPSEDPSAGDSERLPGESRVLLFMGPGRDRELLHETLEGPYRVETTTDVAALDTDFDCCVFDLQEFNRVAGTVQSRRETSSPVFLPFVLLVGRDAAGERSGVVWDYVDDVIELPIKKVELFSRIGNLIERRRTALRLAEREIELEATIEDLKLKERAMDEAPVGITIAEPGDGDDPLVYANRRFEDLTGYDTEVIGHDCRFLQGEETDPDTRARLREAIDAREPASVDILNYRKNGRKFWNKLDVAPLSGGGEDVTHFVGFQTDITDRKIRERRLEVLNRVLSHNLRNKMNVIQGHVALLREGYDGTSPESLDRVEEAASSLIGLAETVRETERTLAASAPAPAPLGDRLTRLLGAFEDRYPDASFDLSLPDERPCEVAVTGLTAALEEAVENAVEHNDSDHPSVGIRATERDGEWVDIEIEDDGPGIPESELRVLTQGETPLYHADRLGLWLIYWVVSKAGGSFSASGGDPSGTVLRLSVPKHAGDQEP